MNWSAKLTTTTALPIEPTEPTAATGHRCSASGRRMPPAGPDLTMEQARAAHGVSMAITRAYDDGLTVPCVADPGTWDADDKPTLRADVARAVRLCLTGCPVLEACRAYLATDPPTGGICAGAYRAQPDDPDRRVERLEGWARATRAELIGELPVQITEETVSGPGRGEEAA